MRHIKQMTYQELNNKINEVQEEMYKVHGKDTIRWNELYYLHDALTTEASNSAKAIGVGTTGVSVGVRM